MKERLVLYLVRQRELLLKKILAQHAHILDVWPLFCAFGLLVYFPDQIDRTCIWTILFVLSRKFPLTVFSKPKFKLFFACFIV